MVETDATLRSWNKKNFGEKNRRFEFFKFRHFLRRIDASTLFLERFCFCDRFLLKNIEAATEWFNLWFHLWEEERLQNSAQDTKTTVFWIRVDFEEFWADEILVEISKGLKPDESQVLDGWTIFFVKKESVHPRKLAWIPKLMFFQYGNLNMDTQN